MLPKSVRFAIPASMAAALSLASSQALASELPRPASAALSGGVSAPLAYDGDAQNVRNRGRGGYGGYGGHGHHHHDNDIDAGDIIAGVLVLGAIAAIVSSGNDDDRYPEPVNYPEPPRYQGDRGDQGRGLDRAVDMCVDQIEIGNDRVQTVDGASRTTDGWQVNGQLEDGRPFDCWIDNDGRIRSIDLDRYSASYDEPGEDRQWDDDFYARARARQDELAAGTAEVERGG